MKRGCERAKAGGIFAKSLRPAINHFIVQKRKRNYVIGNTESNFRVALSFTNLNDYSLGGMIVIRGLYEMGALWKSA